MSFIFNQQKLSQLTNIINEYNKQYFIIKHQYHNHIDEINDRINLFDLIDTQHTLIMELEQTMKFLYEELSFRKMIIERKGRILKELNTVMINKFIDKIYKQELAITEMQKENCILQRYKNNTINLNKFQPNDKINWNIQPIITNITNVKTVPLNVIVPKSKSKYNGTFLFMNSAVKPTPNKPVKNINKFINVKSNKKRAKSIEKAYWSNDKSTKESKINNDSKSKTNRKQHMILRKPNERSKSQVEYLSTYANQDMVPFSTNCSNRSLNNSAYKFNNRSRSRNSQLNKTQTSLLNKSYDIVKKFQLKQHLGKKFWSSKETFSNNIS